MTFYEILGVAQDATDQQIKSAYRQLARQHHPDRNPGCPEAADKFKKVQEAYDTLSDLTERGRYNLTLPKVKPKPKPKPKEEEKPADTGFVYGDAPQPKVDLWGDPIRPQQKQPIFKDSYAGAYDETEGVPEIR